MTDAYPLRWPDGWPRTAASQRKSSRFDTRYMAAFDNLLDQLRLMGASNVVISTNVPLRRDGKPYSEGMSDDIEDPGVALYFAVGKEPRAMARDCYLTPAENLHALGHVIEHIRGIERHGGRYMMARTFSAFAALPSPGAKRPWRTVMDLPTTWVGGKSEIEVRFKDLARKRHPDAGGSDLQMAELNGARDEALREIGNG